MSYGILSHFLLQYRNIRPYGYFSADEKYDVLKDIVPVIDAEVRDIEAGGVTVKTSSGNLYHIMVNTFKMSMVNQKILAPKFVLQLNTLPFIRSMGRSLRHY